MEAVKEFESFSLYEVKKIAKKAIDEMNIKKRETKVFKNISNSNSEL